MERINKKNKRKEIKMATLIDISKTPDSIKTDDLVIEQGHCFLNSYRVAKNNNDTKIVEGLILVVDNENGAKAMPHVWNKQNGVYFDVTSEKILAEKDKVNEIKEIKYFSTKYYKHTHFKNGDNLKFSFDTIENVNAINESLNKNENKQEE